MYRIAAIKSHFVTTDIFQLMSPETKFLAIKTLPIEIVNQDTLSISIQNKQASALLVNGRIVHFRILTGTFPLTGYLLDEPPVLTKQQKRLVVSIGHQQVSIKVHHLIDALNQAFRSSFQFHILDVGEQIRHLQVFLGLGNVHHNSAFTFLDRRRFLATAQCEQSYSQR